MEKQQLQQWVVQNAPTFQKAKEISDLQAKEYDWYNTVLEAERTCRNARNAEDNDTRRLLLFSAIRSIQCAMDLLPEETK